MSVLLKPAVLAVNKFHYRLGGVETYHLALIDLLQSRGHRVAAFAMRHPRNEPSPWAWAFVSQVDYTDPSPWARLRAAARALYSFEARRKLDVVLRAFQPDIAHLQHIYRQLSSSVLDALAVRDTPIVQTVHDYWMVCPNRRMYLTRQQAMCYRCKGGRFYHAVRQRCVHNGLASSLLGAFEAYMQRLTKVYHRRVRKFIVPSQFMAQRLQEAEVDPSLITVLPYFLDASRIAPQFEGEGVLFVGRLEVEKGAQVLLRAARLLPEIPFKIAGSGAEEATLRVLASSLANVHFLGQLTPNQVQAAMQLSRVVVVPSLWHDVAPLVLLEAAAAGKPVIASAVGGIPEIVRDGETGLLVPPGNAEVLAEAIAALYYAPARVAEMGKAARHFVELNHSPEQHYQRLMEIYTAAMR